LEESLKIFRELGDKEGIGWALLDLGRTEAHLRADYAAARPFIEESLKIFREVGAKRPGAISLRALGFIALNQDDYVTARSLLEESLKIFRELRDRLEIGYTLGNMGMVALSQADPHAARLLLEESLRIFQELGSKGGTAWALYVLGKTARLLGDNEQAMVFHRKALTLRGEVGDKKGIITCLEGLAGIACGCRQSARAVRLFGAAEALRRVIHVPLPPSEHLANERDVSTLEAQLEEKAFADAWAEGQAMTPEQAIEYALSDEAD
jgi:tetratricopeptide (TPR) repeat protein